MKKLSIVLCFHEDAGQVNKETIRELTHLIQKKAHMLTLLNLKDKTKETIMNELSRVDLVIAYGGDGTVHHVLQYVLQCDKQPMYAIIPGGTANDFARALHMPLQPVKAIESILKLKTTVVDVGQYDDRYFLNFFGVGLVTDTKQAVSVADTKATLGRFSYYLSSLQSLQSPETFQLTLTSDTKNYQGNAIMVMVGNGQYTGGVRAFFNQANVNDGKFDVLIIKEISAQSLLEMIKTNITPNTESLEGIDYFHATELTIETTPNKPIDCDGEDGGETPAKLFIQKHALTMITGEKSEG
ncbi:bis(5'-nucleosyl)-tetraphosphatase [Halolactibacillus alkaliphilus]|uniref:Bis(5'-nucleosyl)-tetraphosphatase n=1 Tax=Halolactibacillus alkaliphilus TaxID=442899 RepID=A0A511X2E0_9BACI|nr:diacylglycerol kinase family protein [Halolactibacillus alkaliphilus]GEN57116.1 bis(5'-nucleosyl)-tetraphosphatase [Halolactibacillus alkaliphilus]GGN72046.1 bis(5'-nucleosyl)-tetraphosphatase [Halolactibacillus alkaliphilus]SFO86606.1 lipid kinase, YegS/Rv2252/BmrU family [Halolactibacillus alkaliphilus]